MTSNGIQLGALINFAFGGFGAGGGGGGDVNYIHQGTLELTDAQIKTLPTASVVIIAAPAAGQLIVPVALTAILTIEVGGSYGTISTPSYLGLRYRAAGSLLWQCDMDGTGQLQSEGVNPIIFLPNFPLIQASQFSPSTLDIGQGLRVNMVNVAGNLSLGDPANTMVVSVAYLLLDITTGLFVAAA